MNPREYAEAVYLFVDGQVAAELSYADFEAHIDRQTQIPGAPPGRSVCRAGFVLIGPNLQLHGLVFFLLQVDDYGRPDKNFNVPLPYLATNASAGPDLGYGPVPMACRGSCSVPWHANNLWDPTQEDVRNPMQALVAAVEANQLGFDPQPLPTHGEEAAGEDMGAQINQLSATHTAQLMELQERHEAELAQQRAVLEAKTELYRLEVVRLKEELARLANDSDAAAAGG